MVERYRKGWVGAKLTESAKLTEMAKLASRKGIKMRMRWILIGFGVAAGLFVGSLQRSVVVAQEPVLSDEVQAALAAQEAAIRGKVDQFVKAYNAKDAQAVAELFLKQAFLVDEDDNVVQGRENIEAIFADLFAENPDTGVEVNVESIRFITSSLAVELGSTTTVPPAGVAPESGRYSCVHVLQNGDWKMGVIRDIPAKPTHRDQLQALSWMVGDWVDQSRDGMVKTSCRYTPDGSFLIQEVTVHPRTGGDAISMTQRIGWDPLGKRFKSWVFDSEGGYGESNWTTTDGGWLIKFTGVSSDGAIASATNHIRPLGLDKYLFQSVDRVVGNEAMPPLEVTVVRQPPAPQSPPLESPAAPAPGR